MQVQYIENDLNWHEKKRVFMVFALLVCKYFQVSQVFWQPCTKQINESMINRKFICNHGLSFVLHFVCILNRIGHLSISRFLCLFVSRKQCWDSAKPSCIHCSVWDNKALSCHSTGWCLFEYKPAIKFCYN